MLAIGDFPRYFQALAGHRVVPIHSDDPTGILDEFREPYLEPLGIRAMLDAAVYRGGRMTGVVCHEHIGSDRGWTDADCACGAAVADAIARLYEEHERAEAEQHAERHLEASASLQHLSELGRLAAGMAHDINNILTAVMGNAELLASEGQDKDPSLRGLIDAAQRGVSLTRQLSQLGREGRRTPRVVDLARLVGDDERLLRLAAGPDVDLRLDLTRDVGLVFVDAAEIGRAVLNLVTNARDASPPGGRVTVRVYESPREGHDESPLVTVEVSDTGQGMDESAQRRAFEPFFTTKGERGTGLGLSIVRQMVGLAGGSVEFESRPIEGTTVRLHLPSIAPARG